MNGSVVWVTRPEPGNHATSQALEAAGWVVVSVPLLEVSYPDSPVIQIDSAPDWILFVSGHGVIGLEKSLGSDWSPAARKKVKVAAVGPRTAARAGDHGWVVERIPDLATAAGLEKDLGEIDFAGRSVWIPAGNQPGSARQALPAFITAQGGIPRVLSVYEVQPRVLPVPDREHLKTAVPGMILIHSPSTADVLFGKEGVSETKAWLTAPVISIGPATTRRCRELGATPAMTCDSPSDEAVLDAVSSLQSRLERKLS